MNYSFFLIFLSLPMLGLSQTKNLLQEQSISTPLNERDFTISPEGDEVYFTRSHFDHKTRVILAAKKSGNEYTDVEVASFSGKFNDLEPFFSPNGQRIYFASNRDLGQIAEKRDYDIWYVERQEDEGWGAAVRLPSLINTEKDEFYPAVGESGNLYFTGVRENGIGTEDIFLSKYVNGEYQTPIPLSENINSKTYEFNAFVNPREDLIIFSSFGREDDLGGGDLYYSIKDDFGNWIPAANLGDRINSASLDYCPYYDEENGILYFTSNLGMPKAVIEEVKDLEKEAFSILNGFGNIYWVKLGREFSGR